MISSNISYYTSTGVHKEIKIIKESLVATCVETRGVLRGGVEGGHLAAVGKKVKGEKREEKRGGEEEGREKKGGKRKEREKRKGKKREKAGEKEERGEKRRGRRG